MRAIVLLCLLHAASANQTYGWNGPGVTVDSSPYQDSACNADQASCGCCLMLQKLDKLKMYLNSTLDELEEEYLEIDRSLNHIRANHTAFSAALYIDSRKCNGPFQENQIVLYKHVFINLGDSYDNNTGIFTVPHSGVYSIALSVYSDAGSPGNTLAACATLQVNGKAMAQPREENNKDQEDSATVVLARHLQAGDQVSVSLRAGCFLCDDSSHYNTFSVFQLYPTD